MSFSVSYEWEILFLKKKRFTVSPSNSSKVPCEKILTSELKLYVLFCYIWLKSNLREFLTELH